MMTHAQLAAIRDLMFHGMAEAIKFAEQFHLPNYRLTQKENGMVHMVIYDEDETPTPDD